MKRLAIVCLLMLAAVAIPHAQPPAETLDPGMIAKIRDEGLKRSQVMDHISWLSDVYGPRLTGGPGIKQAADWTLKRFGEWGLANAHLETFPFGTGWSLVRFSAHLIEPQVEPLIGFPGSWTPGTNGPVLADVVRVQVETDADFDKYRGRLGGTIVLTQPARAVRMLEGPFGLRIISADAARGRRGAVLGASQVTPLKVGPSRPVRPGGLPPRERSKGSVDCVGTTGESRFPHYCATRKRRAGADAQARQRAGPLGARRHRSFEFSFGGSE